MKKRWRPPINLGLMLSRGQNDMALDYAVGLYWKNRT